MLTLQELKQIVDVPYPGKKIPTAKKLKEYGTVIAKKSMGCETEILAFQNGYALYQVSRFTTVFPICFCGKYQYNAEQADCISEEFFNQSEWYIRLALEGEDRLSLQEAAELYQTIPADRMNGIKGIGFRLEDGSIYDGTYELMTAGKMQTEFINEIPHYRDSQLVQQAIVDMEEILDKWKEKELTEPEKEKPLEPGKQLKKHRKRTYRQPRVKGRNSLSYRRSGKGRRS